MLPTRQTKEVKVVGKSVLLSNKVNLSFYSVSLAFGLVGNFFLIYPSEALKQYLRMFYSSAVFQQLSSAGFDTEVLNAPAALNSVRNWTELGIVGLLVSALLWFMIYARANFIGRKYSSCPVTGIALRTLGVISFFPLVFGLEAGCLLANSAFADAVRRLATVMQSYTAATEGYFDIALYSGMLTVAVGASVCLVLGLAAALFPVSLLRMKEDGLAVSAGYWKNLIGEREIAWDEIQSVSFTGSGKERALNMRLKDGCKYRFALSALQKHLNLAELMSNLRSYAATALDQSCMFAIDSSQNQYTELWLKYFSSSTSRNRSGALQSGEIVNEGRYEIAGELGQGGQGTAYLAAHVNPESEDEGTTIVLKEYILPVHKGEAIFQQSLKKLQQEASILGKIQHPNIVELKDTFVEDHRGYLVMEYIEGEGLKQMAEAQGPQPEQVVIDIAIQICNALEHLHNMDPPVIHRDLTPDNLILQTSGRVKLVDFNVAHQLESSATATVVGKHAYIPPEQFRGKPVPQSDIFALGGTLHFLLTAKEPEPLSVSHPAALNASVSKELDAIVARATAIDQNDRYQNAFELRAELYDLARTRGYILNSAVSADVSVKESVKETIESKQSVG